MCIFYCELNLIQSHKCNAYAPLCICLFVCCQPIVIRLVLQFPSFRSSCIFGVCWQQVSNIVEQFVNAYRCLFTIFAISLYDLFVYSYCCCWQHLAWVMSILNEHINYLFLHMLVHKGYLLRIYLCNGCFCRWHSKSYLLPKVLARLYGVMQSTTAACTYCT